MTDGFTRARLTGDLCSMLQMSIEAALARRDWLVLMVGVAAVCVITGSGTAGEWGMEAFGLRRPLGVSIMAWILSSVGSENRKNIFLARIQVIILFFLCMFVPAVL